LYNNCQSGEANRIIQACTEFIQHYPEPLKPALLEIYFVLAKYNLINNQNRAQTERYLQLATSVTNSNYPAYHFNFGILYHLKGEYNYDFFDPTNALFYCNLSIEILEFFPAFSRYVYENRMTKAGIYYHYQVNYYKTINYCNKVIRLLENTNRSPAYFYYMIGLCNCIIWYKPAESEYYLEKTIDMTSGRNNAYDLTLCSEAYYNIAQL
jgi:hypothetical protein